MSASEKENLESEETTSNAVKIEKSPGACKNFPPIPSWMDSCILNLAMISEKVQFTQKMSSPCLMFGEKVCITVHNQDLWTSFSDIGNEMIVTRPGRLVKSLIVSHTVSSVTATAKVHVPQINTQQSTY